MKRLSIKLAPKIQDAILVVHYNAMGSPCGGALQQKRGILRSKYPRKQQRNQIPKTHNSEHEFVANS
jgi:hypothetical protein